MTAAVAQKLSELSCLIIPLNGSQLLLPSVCVAEILPWRRIKPLKQGPDWCLGELGWRGEALPVIRFERLNQPSSEVPASGRCLVVMNRTHRSGGIAFYALATDGLPRMVQLTEADLVTAEDRPGKAEASVVRLGTEIASIPDLAYLEVQAGSLRG
jgi:chemosensory pili system protein ChpC